MRVDDVVGWLVNIAGVFGLMVVEHQEGLRRVGQVGGDVAPGDVDLAVLHVFGVDKQHVVNHAEFTEQDAADETIEVAAGHESVLGLAQGIPLYWCC